MIASGWFRLRVVPLSKICSLNFTFLLIFTFIIIIFTFIIIFFVFFVFFCFCFGFWLRQVNKLLRSLQNATNQHIFTTSSKLFAVQITTFKACVSNVREQTHKERPLCAVNAARTTSLVVVVQDKEVIVLNYSVVSPNIQFKPFGH